MSEAILKNIDKRLKRLEAAVFGANHKLEAGGRSKTRQSKKSTFSGPTGGIRLLISKGFFKRKQGLAEVRTTLSENGYHYSRQAVHVALNNLTRKGGPLVSLEESGRKVYVERK